MSFPGEKGPIEPLLNSDSSFSENTTNTSSNAAINKGLADTTATSRKDLSNIFKLDVTNRRLETINKKIEQLTDKSTELENDLQDKHSDFVSVGHQLSDLDLELKELSTLFDQRLLFYDIKDIQIILNLRKRRQFLQTVKKEDQEQTMEIINNLRISYIDIQVKEAVLNEKSKEKNDLKKEIAKLKKQFATHQTFLDQTKKKHEDIKKHGLLKSCESSDPKVFRQDMIAPPVLEDQFNKLITMYKNRDEARNFGLSLSKGILFVGEKETGKTFAARVFASEIGRKMYHIKAHDIFTEGEQNPNELLCAIFDSIISHTKKTSVPCIIFLDEIEKIISGAGERSSTEKITIFNTIKKTMINIQKSGLDIAILAAVTEKNKLDEGFLKYDMFDSQFFFSLPQENERKRLFELYITKAENHAKLKLFDTEMLGELVKKTNEFSAEHIKQLVSSCVKEYFYNYMQKKPSFIIDQDFIGTALEQIGSQKQTTENPLSPARRKKILDALIIQYTMKHSVFGILDVQKKNSLLQYMLDHTESYTESELNQLIQICVDEYQKRKSNYHKQSLIQKDFVLAKIQQMNEEEKIKGRRSYYR